MKFIKSIKEIVLEILMRHPKARSNDVELLYQYCKVKHLPTDLEQLRFKKFSLLSVTRMRQKVQEQFPQLVPSTEIQKKRKKLAGEMKEFVKSE